jgi:hypothetical protein
MSLTLTQSLWTGPQWRKDGSAIGEYDFFDLKKLV